MTPPDKAITPDLVRSKGTRDKSPGCWEEYIFLGRRWFLKGEDILKAVPLPHLPQDQALQVS